MPTELLKINIVDPDIKQINHAVEVLRLGGLVVLPTETVYGVGINSKSKLSYDRLQKIKNRFQNKPFSLAVSDKEQINELALDIPLFVYKLTERFWPGPLTIVLKAKSGGTIGFRMPDNKVTLMIIDMLGSPIYLTSANISGNVSPRNVQDALKDLDGQVELAVDTGSAELGVDSTVIEAADNKYKILRQGAVNDADIKRIVESKNILFVCTGNSCRSVMAEGLLRKFLSKRANIQISSAGVIASFGIGPTQETVKMLALEGIDMKGHVGRKVTSEILKSADLILVMEKFHEERIKAMEPSARNRVFLLKEFAKIKDGSLEIKDPIGRGESTYFEVFSTIKDAVERMSKIV